MREDSPESPSSRILLLLFFSKKTHGISSYAGGCQHFCFIGCGFLFWWPVVQPWPRIPAEARCVTIIYLVPAAILTIRLLAAGGLPEDELA